MFRLSAQQRPSGTTLTAVSRKYYEYNTFSFLELKHLKQRFSSHTNDARKIHVFFTPRLVKIMIELTNTVFLCVLSVQHTCPD